MNISRAYLAAILTIVCTSYIYAADVVGSSNSVKKGEKFTFGLFGHPSWGGYGMGFGAVPGLLGCPGWLSDFGGFGGFGVAGWPSAFGWGNYYGHPGVWFKAVGAQNEVARRSIDLTPPAASNLMERGEAIFQCKNQQGEVHTFLRADCYAAAEKLVKEKAASAAVQSCGLGLASKSGPVQAQAIPPEQLKATVDKILGACDKVMANQPAKRSRVEDEHIQTDEAHSIVVLLQKGEI